MTQNVEIFKALRIIKIMLFCAKTKKKKNFAHWLFHFSFCHYPNKQSFFAFLQFLLSDIIPTLSHFNIEMTSHS